MDLYAWFRNVAEAEGLEPDELLKRVRGEKQKEDQRKRKSADADQG